MTVEARPSTLGERLERDARRRRARHRQRPAWLRLLEPVLERVSALAATEAQRFDRVEAPLSAAAPPPIKAREEQDDGDHGELLAPAVRERLRRAIGPAGGDVRVHADADADLRARSLDADAVTVGRDVYFRHERFRPHEDRGFALLAHEASHVQEATRPGAAWRRATRAGLEAEESTALRVESDVLAGRPRPQPPAAPRAVASTNAGAAAPTPLAAEERRALPEAPAPAPAIDLGALRRDLQRDLLMALQTEYERGG